MEEVGPNSNSFALLNSKTWVKENCGGDEHELRPTAMGPTDHFLKDGLEPKVWIVKRAVK